LGSANNNDEFYVNSIKIPNKMNYDSIQWSVHMHTKKKKKKDVLSQDLMDPQISVLFFVYLLAPKPSQWISLGEPLHQNRSGTGAIKKDLTLSISQRHFHISKKAAKVV